MWWSNNEQRRQQKEAIKNIIKRTKLSEKAANTVTLSTNTPPSLCHSVPTSDTFSEEAARTRGASLESQLSLDYPFHTGMPHDIYDTSMMPPPQLIPSYPPFAPHYSPYEVDIKTESQTFVDDIPTRKDSTISTFSAYPAPPLSGTGLEESWIQRDYFESQRETFAEEPVDFNFFEFAHGPMTPTHQAIIQVDDCDQHLLNHFIDNVLRLIFPILEANQHGSTRNDLILPALESNKCYLDCCLSISALHLRSLQGSHGPHVEQLDLDVTRLRYSTINELCTALARDTDHAQILEATLGMIFFQCTVGRPDDGLPDIPWHHHFQAATSLINRLEYPQSLARNSNTHPPFNMTLAAWIDILGATMLCRPPVFADTYREKNVAMSSAGLAELMGCEDSVMFLISEIACLEALKKDGMDDGQVCAHVRTLGEHISQTDPGPAVIDNAYSATGAIRPKQLSKNVTAVFRLAARIYLCGLVPGYDRQQMNVAGLVDQLTGLMGFIPAGPDGFDRSLAWPLLIAGSASLPGSQFRTMFAQRSDQMGDLALSGSFGRIRELLQDVWQLSDEALARGEIQGVHWRDVMQQKGWDFLLI